MKLHGFYFRIFKDLIYILPAIVLSFNDPYICKQNFAIEFRWLLFHARLLWISKIEDKCCTCKHYASGEYDGSCDSYICEHYSNYEKEDE